LGPLPVIIPHTNRPKSGPKTLVNTPEARFSDVEYRAI